MRMIGIKKKKKLVHLFLNFYTLHALGCILDQLVSLQSK